ncbi:nickel ABC transporter permease subunit NikC [Gorillibacterium sp. sgz5001074]|uniref:nickel ABC transporter permease subunit NikC n=1 Tax=Gorillibacterium sp. sgz5001074 TaxID=3446695 RepID=UPI003F673361
MIAMARATLRGPKIITVCLSILIVLVLVTVFAPWLAPHDPIQVNLANKLQSASFDYPLGTDHLGRCNLSRLLYGARFSLGFAALIFVASLGIGLVVGSIAGYRGGVIDYILMRFCDGVLAFPNLVLILGLVGIFGPGLWQVVLAMMLVQWVYYARMFRGMIMSLKERPFITAAKISGSSERTIILRRMLPNVLPPVAVMGALEMGWAIMDISALSFLGLGIQPPAPEWGAMIHEGKQYIRSHPELMLYPGIMILLVIVTFNLLGEALSERFSVKRRLEKE